MDVPTSWSRSIVETLRRRWHASHSKSWRRQTLCDDWRIAHEEKQFCVEASTVIDGRSQEGREGRRRGCEPTDQRGGRRKGFRAAHRGVLCGTGRQGRDREGASGAQALGQGKRAGSW